ncbi:Cytochrome P450 [Lentzea waywayandensis]|uniref:Cytochrome P450 n=1 Tax=Lentzea waywayandensis TaxID=84724 RepID=A0A1I6F1B7_9PSEU|nr:cytochrome P450 [Lentzea waywayandensis]SFR23701.1 Cytochrome P450 [Lentzea waywayandensis]
MPLSPMTYPDGHVGWRAHDHATVRAVLADSRFSIRPDLMHNPFGPGSPGDAPPSPPGAFTDHDPPEHTRYRGRLTGQFTVRRMRLLAERLEVITAEHLDALAAQGSPADLVEHFAVPVPGLMICELLGVPYERRTEFQQDAMVLTGASGAGADEAVAMLAAFERLQRFMLEMVATKRAEPTDDVLSDLVHSESAGAGESPLTDDEMAAMGMALLGGGLDTTTNMLSLGALELLRERARVEAMLADPGAAVEELLRYISLTPATARTALEDVEIDGVVVRAGDTVFVELGSANRDPARYADPDVLDLARGTTGHLAFGHGIHQCIGQHLARIELKIAFPGLFTRFPKLRLAVSEDELPHRASMVIGGLERMPVAWD